MTIPIRNLYYLFCYAWERYPEGDAVEVGIDECPDLVNLFARVLISGTNRLLKRGLDRGYLAFEEELRSPRGRFLIDQSLKAQTLERAALMCLVDDLSHDVLHNQLIKATAVMLSRDSRVAPRLAHDLRIITKRLGDVSDIRVSLGLFGRVQLSRNSRSYRQLLRTCEFVWRATLPEEGGQGSRFGDILKNEELMSKVFEVFLLNFYRWHAPQFAVNPEDMRWRVDASAGGDPSLVPLMKTDLTLRSASATIVMDAKFYADPFPRAMGLPKMRSGHLFQLYAYMKHASDRAPGVPVRGALVYAAPSGSAFHRYSLDGHDIAVSAIDLSQPWQTVHDELLTLLSHLSPPDRLVVASVG